MDNKIMKSDNSLMDVLLHLVQSLYQLSCC